jgi:hypothetical protein
VHHRFLITLEIEKLAFLDVRLQKRVIIGAVLGRRVSELPTLGRTSLAPGGRWELETGRGIQIVFKRWHGVTRV